VLPLVLTSCSVPGKGADPTVVHRAAHTAGIGVLTLHRRGELLDLVLSITPHFEQVSRFSAEMFSSAISLADNVGREHHLVPVTS
jgi:hypothetical protein